MMDLIVYLLFVYHLLFIYESKIFCMIYNICVCVCVLVHTRLHTFIQTCNVSIILSRDADSLEDVQMLNSGHSFVKNGSVH